jgi:hypothetical protein
MYGTSRCKGGWLRPAARLTVWDDVGVLQSPGWLRIDPTFASLEGNPRFEKLIAGR